MQVQPPVVPSFSRRILSRLTEAEAQETDAWLRDDLRIARLTVLYAATGEAVLCSPHVLASYMVLGLHPEKVWPAILAREAALWGPMCPSDAPPKKPAQAVSLWCEKTNGARAVNSRAEMQQGSPRTVTSVPMAAPSIAALYPNSEAQHSGKTRDFSLAELKLLVGYSGAPGPIRALTISALRARGEWPHEDGPATAVLSVAILGMMLEGVCCRSTVQRRIKRAVQLGYWRRLRDANSWTDCPKCGAKRSAAKCACGYRGRSRDDNGKWTGEFMRVPVYEFDVHKFRSAPRCREINSVDWRSYAEYKEAARRGDHRNVTEMPRKTPQPAPTPENRPPAAPVKQPAAEHAHRNTARPESKPQPKLTRRECAKLIADIAVLMRGADGHNQIDGYRVTYSPSDPRYRPKMNFREALLVAAQHWKREPEVILEAFKFWGYRVDSDPAP